MAAVGPALGVVQGNWGKTWWELRQQLGDQFGSGAPLMPAPDGEGIATVRPLSTGEFSKWVRMILDRNGGLQEDCKISSHSCKATMLSFLAKFGASIPDRLNLGWPHRPHEVCVDLLQGFTCKSVEGPDKHVGAHTARVFRS